LSRAWTLSLLSASVLLGFGIAPSLAVRGTASEKQAVPKLANELLLAGLRPGRNKIPQAQRMYRLTKKDPTDGIFLSHDVCLGQTLTLTEDNNEIETIRVVDDGSDHTPECSNRSGKPRLNRWVTGRGLKIGDSQQRVIDLYGQPNSRSPSTKDGKPLELLYYAFDWAGPDVPQVMEVVCTRDKDGKPGRVVEITLAAASL